MSSRKPSPRQRFYDAAAQSWRCQGTGDHQALVDAAVQALAEGLDSGSLRELAGARVDNCDAADFYYMLDDVVTDLDLPFPERSGPPYLMPDDGGVVPRKPAESIRFDVVQADVNDGFSINVHVDEVEMTSRAAGLGMAPRDLLVPVNRLVATPEPTVVPIARCECGEYGCGSTDVRVQRDGDVVHWDWLKEAPARHGVTFYSEQYDTEVARLAADLTWERSQDTAERLLMTRSDGERLAAAGLKLSWGWPAPDDPSLYRVALETSDFAFRIHLHFPIDGRPLTDVVDDALMTLAKPPQTWRAQFYAPDPKRMELPAIAGSSWARYELAPGRR